MDTNELERIRVGILSNSTSSTGHSGCLQRAEKHGIELFYFRLPDVKRKTKTINATYRGSRGKTYKKEVPYPDIVCNGILCNHPTFRHLRKHVILTRPVIVLDKVKKYREADLLKSEYRSMVIPHKIMKKSEDIADV